MNEKKKQELIDAFARIESHDLKVNTVICTVCDHIFTISDKESKPCKHLKEMFESFK